MKENLRISGRRSYQSKKNEELNDSGEEHRSNPPSPAVLENHENVIEFDTTVEADFSSESFSSSVNQFGNESQSRNTSHKSTKFQKQQTPAPKEPSRSRQPQKSQEHHPPNSGWIVSWTKSLSIIVALLAVVVVVYIQVRGVQDTRKTCSYLELKHKYPNQSDLIWKTLKFRTENMLNGTSDSPDVYLFLHNDKDFMRDFICDVAKETSQCFGPQNEAIEFLGDEFTNREVLLDYGLIIEKFKAKVKENSAVVVANINKIPAEAVRSLHTICDIYSPLVKNVIIFLSLILPEIDDNPPVQVAVDKCRELWGPKLASNEVDALITRVTDQVFVLRN